MHTRSRAVPSSLPTFACPILYADPVAQVQKNTVLDFGSFGIPTNSSVHVSAQCRYTIALLSFLLSCFLWLLTSTPASAQSYTVITLGTLGGDFSDANGINNTGQVVGILN